MIILGIETSCDETAVAIIEMAGSGARPRLSVLANVVLSQMKLHAKYGGVVPNLAKREHQRNLVPVLLEALHHAGLLQRRKFGNEYDRIYFRNQKFGADVIADVAAEVKEILEREPELFARMVPHMLQIPPPAIDAIAVTVGPGLAPALWVGVNFARALSYLWGKPIIPVNHLEGHIVTNLIPQIRENSKSKARNPKQIPNPKFQSSSRPNTYHLTPITFPALCLIVSGGHTELVLMRRSGDYRVLGETRDDAAGEAFDKVAKMMNLGFPGGPVISRLAESGDERAFNFPRPMLGADNFDFSFSGLKTAVLYTIRDLRRLPAKAKRDIAASFEQAVVDVLTAKTIRAAKQYRVKTVMIGGGVAANKKLRHELGAALAMQHPTAKYLVPSTSLTGDNALMIALAGWFNRRQKQSWRNLSAEANLRLDAKTPH